jgi:hypothetical protein
MKRYPFILLLTLILPAFSLLAYWGAESLPNGPIPFILSFLVILPNFAGLLIINTLFPASVSNPADPFHMIAGIIVNWVILTGTLTLIRAIAHMKRK